MLDPISDRAFRLRVFAALDEDHLRRRRLARILHDDVAQTLSAVGLQLELLHMDLDCAAPGFTPGATQVQELLDGVVQRVRELSYELSPGIVERAGLQLALDVLAGRFRKLFSGNLRLVYDSSVSVPLDAAVAMEHIAEEAVLNAIQHSNAAQIEIIVKAAKSGAEMIVSDDGIGFDCDTAQRFPSGLGLLLMEYWGEKAGLAVSVRRNNGPGTTVSVSATGSPEDKVKKIEGSVYAA